jgi:hypothetical protein
MLITIVFVIPLASVCEQPVTLASGVPLSNGVRLSLITHHRSQILAGCTSVEL